MKLTLNETARRERDRGKEECHQRDRERARRTKERGTHRMNLLFIQLCESSGHDGLANVTFCHGYAVLSAFSLKIPSVLFISRRLINWSRVRNRRGFTRVRAPFDRSLQSRKGNWFRRGSVSFLRWYAHRVGKRWNNEQEIKNGTLSSQYLLYLLIELRAKGEIRIRDFYFHSVTQNYQFGQNYWINAFVC